MSDTLQAQREDVFTIGSDIVQARPDGILANDLADEVVARLQFSSVQIPPREVLLGSWVREQLSGRHKGNRRTEPERRPPGTRKRSRRPRRLRPLPPTPVCS